MSMKSLIFTTIFFLAVLVPIPSHAYYNINLQNGEVLQAEDCKVEGNKLNVKFKEGYASFPLSLVNSVTNQDGKVSNFSSTGELLKPDPAAAAPPPAQPQPTQPQPAQAATPQVPAPPSASLDPLTAHGGTSPGVSDGGQPAVEDDAEEITEEEPGPDDDESSVSDGATDVSP